MSPFKQVRDQFGNASTAAVGALTAQHALPESTSLVELEPPKIRGGIGSYEIGLEPVKAGVHVVHLRLDGHEITGSPVSFKVSTRLDLKTLRAQCKPSALPAFSNRRVHGVARVRASHASPFASALSYALSRLTRRTLLRSLYAPSSSFPRYHTRRSRLALPPSPSATSPNL